MKRRGFSVVMGAALCGCVTSIPGYSDQTGPAERPEDDASSPNSSGDGADVATRGGLESKGPSRGESQADLAIRETEDGENVKYVEAEHAVRYVAAWRHSNHDAVEEGEPPEREPVYETTPFADWAETQCRHAAARAAADHVAEQLGATGISSGSTSAVEGEGSVALVSVHTTLDRDGDVVSEAPVEFDALVAATPATVHVTYHLGDQEYQLDAPVYASYDVRHHT